MKRLLIPGFLCLAALPAHAALVAAYTFDETSGTTAADSVRGGAGNATLKGAGATFSTGKIGNALTLNNTSGAWAEALNPVITNQAQLSVSAWVNLAGNTAWGSIAKDWDSTHTFHFGLDNTSQTFSNYIGNNTNGPAKTSAVSLNTWYHVVFTFDDVANTQSIYLNGVLAATSAGATPGTFAAGGAGTMGIGGNTLGAQLLNGKIDDLAFYDNALTQSDITTLYNNGLAGVSAVPEPSTYGLIGAGALAGVAFVRRRRRR